MIREVCTVSMCYRCNSFGGIKSKDPTISLNGKDYYPVECSREECPAGDTSSIDYPIPPTGGE